MKREDIGNIYYRAEHRFSTQVTTTNQSSMFRASLVQAEGAVYLCGPFYNGVFAPFHVRIAATPVNGTQRS